MIRFWRRTTLQYLIYIASFSVLLFTAPAQAQTLSLGCIIYDGTGGISVGGSFNDLPFNAGERIVSMADFPVNVIPATQIRMEIDGVIVDTDSFPGTVSYTFQSDGIYDVGSFGNGQNLTWSNSCSYVGLSNPDESAGVIDAQPQPAFFDGRINDYDTGNPVVLYGVKESNDIWGLEVYTTDGDSLFYVTPQQIAAVPECPENNSLIYEDDVTGISIWRLPPRTVTAEAGAICPFQLNAPASDPGKLYIIVFDTLYPGTYYESWEEFADN